MMNMKSARKSHGYVILGISFLMMILIVSCVRKADQAGGLDDCLPPTAEIRGTPGSKSCGVIYIKTTTSLIAGENRTGTHSGLPARARILVGKSQETVLSDPDRIIDEPIGRHGSLEINLSIATSDVTWTVGGQCYRESYDQPLYIAIIVKGYKPLMLRIGRSGIPSVIELHK